MAEIKKKLSINKMAKSIKKSPSISLSAQMAEKILWVSNVKSDYLTVEAADKLMQTRLEKNELPIVLPKIKSLVNITNIDEFEIYRFGNLEHNNKCILYLHGGAYIAQPLRQHWKFVDYLNSKTNLPIYLPVYPKAPKYNYVDGYNYIMKVYKDLINKGYTEIIIMGDSAGAGMALSLCELLKADGLLLPKKLILMSPWVDLTMENPDINKYEKVDPMLSAIGLNHIAKKWANGTDLYNYLLSPIYGDLNDLPEIDLFIGTHEIFLPDVKLLYEKLKLKGNKIKYFEYKMMNHVFPLYPIPEANFAKKEIVNLINRAKKEKQI